MKLNEKYDDYYFPCEAPEKKDGHAGYLTEEQEAKVEQLRMLLEAEGFTDRLDTLTLLRFLRARGWTVTDPVKPNAKTMFVDCEKWRKDIKLDEILPTWDFPEKAKVSEYYVQYYHKTDKDGRPVYIETLGSIDLNKIKEITTEERMLMNLAVEYERVADPRLPACSHKTGHLLETCCTVMDLAGVSAMKIPNTYDYLKKASALSQNYYPERLGKLYVINAPWGFSAIWNFISGWLDPVTRDKIKVLGSGYKKELLAQVPAENLPEAYGGTCKCVGGCENSDDGPWKDPAHARTPKWAQKKDDKTLENKGSEIETPGGVDAGAAAPAGDADVALQPAPAAA